MNLELYHKETCPFSAKVRDYIAEHGLKSKIAYHDVSQEPESLEALMDMNDDEQVPCLVVDGKPMLESDDIIRWLESNEKQLH